MLGLYLIDLVTNVRNGGFFESLPTDFQAINECSLGESQCIHSGIRLLKLLIWLCDACEGTGKYYT